MAKTATAKSSPRTIGNHPEVAVNTNPNPVPEDVGVKKRKPQTSIVELIRLANTLRDLDEIEDVTGIPAGNILNRLRDAKKKWGDEVAIFLDFPDRRRRPRVDLEELKRVARDSFVEGEKMRQQAARTNPVNKSRR